MKKRTTRAELISVGNVGAVVVPRKHLTDSKHGRGRYSVGIGKVPSRNQLTGVPRVDVGDGMWFSESQLQHFAELSYHVAAYLATQALVNKDDALREAMVSFAKDFNRRKWWTYPLFTTRRSRNCCGCAVRKEMETEKLKDEQRKRGKIGDGPYLVQQDWSRCTDVVELIVAE